MTQRLQFKSPDWQEQILLEKKYQRARWQNTEILRGVVFQLLGSQPKNKPFKEFLSELNGFTRSNKLGGKKSSQLLVLQMEERQVSYQQLNL